MGVTTDFAMTHLRRVGTGKGPAVQTLRAHVCKNLYPQIMQKTLADQPNLTVIEAEVESVLSQNGKVSGVRIRLGGQIEEIECRSAVLTTGTFMNGLCHRGTEKTVAARHGDPAVAGLSQFLKDLGVRLRRFKTGTTPRVSLKSLDLTGLECMDSELELGAMSFMHDRPMVDRKLYDCWQTHTQPATHELLASRLHESAMYSGQIEGVGPRYCPSIEDKIVRFAGKDSHPVFLEIEEWDGDSVYVQGFSTSLPAETQLDALRTIPGLENVEVHRYGYAVEYDMADPQQLHPSLMSKLMPGLFLAGQVNGTSGYEEAAAQGIVAGINAARWANDEEAVIFGRDQAFLGVMIDDLVVKGVDDPYRMLTARAEHRLLLRHDNADQRLTPIARAIGLCSEERWARFQTKMDRIQESESFLRSESISSKNNGLLEEMGHPPVLNRVSLFEMMKRPKFGLSDARELCDKLDIEWNVDDCQSGLGLEVRDQIELAAKYDGYLQIQERVVAKQRKLDDVSIPGSFDYQAAKGLSYESIEKLSRVRPSTLGQASRIPGMRPSDILLLVGLLGRSRSSLRRTESKPEEAHPA